jgi:hypothetical protein
MWGYVGAEGEWAFVLRSNLVKMLTKDLSRTRWLDCDVHASG